MFDRVRIDHFRGFESYWAIPAGDEDATGGEWKKGPGMELFDRVKEVLGERKIIAEDLGVITDEVRELLKASGFPGMKVMEFAFTPNVESDYMPHNHVQNAVCYTGTHDNEPLYAWLKSRTRSELNYMKKYLRITENEDCADAVLAAVWASPANTAIAQMQDFLGLGAESRMNTPSTASGNWCWRVKKDQLTPAVSNKIKALTKLYWR